MNKLSVFFAALLVILLACTPAFAESAMDGTAAYMNEAGILAALFEKITSDMTEEEVQAILSDFVHDIVAAPQAGTITGDVYTHPAGFSLRVPEGYRVLSDQLGATVHLIGVMEDSTYAPSIQVMVYDVPQPDFEYLTQQKVDSYFGPIFPGYQFISLDHYEYLGVSAHEFVCLHGSREDAMMIQYSLCFNKGDKAYILTMTTLAEEAAHQNALEAYDFFLAGFHAPDTLEAQNEGNG